MPPAACRSHVRPPAPPLPPPSPPPPPRPRPPPSASRPHARPPVRLCPTSIESDLRTLQAILGPRRILRWVYVGRLSLASAIYLASLYVWKLAEIPANT